MRKNTYAERGWRDDQQLHDQYSTTDLPAFRARNPSRCRKARKAKLCFPAQGSWITTQIPTLRFLQHEKKSSARKLLHARLGSSVAQIGVFCIRSRSECFFNAFRRRSPWHGHIVAARLATKYHHDAGLKLVSTRSGRNGQRGYVRARIAVFQAPYAYRIQGTSCLIGSEAASAIRQTLRSAVCSSRGMLAALRGFPSSSCFLLTRYVPCRCPCFLSSF